MMVMSPARHPELVSGSYFLGAEKIKMLKQIQHDWAGL